MKIYLICAELVSMGFVLTAAILGITGHISIFQSLLLALIGLQASMLWLACVFAVASVIQTGSELTKGIGISFPVSLRDQPVDFN